MDKQPIIDFLEGEIVMNTAVIAGIDRGDRWTHDDGTGMVDVTDRTLADCRRKVKEASEHLVRLKAI